MRRSAVMAPILICNDGLLTASSNGGMCPIATIAAMAVNLSSSFSKRLIIALHAFCSRSTANA